MKISDLLSMCADNLRRRKARSVLTIIGVVVGTVSIVVMISFGVAIDVQQEEMLAGMGDLTQIEVYNWNSGSGNTTPPLDDTQVANIQALNGVVAATPVYYPRYLSAMLFAGRNDRYETWPNIVGMYPDAVTALGYELISGDYLPSSTPNNTRVIPVIVGQYTAFDFYDTRRNSNNMVWPERDENGELMQDPFFDITRETITLRTNEVEQGGRQLEYELRVVGVMLEDYNRGYYTSRGIIVDINLLKALEEEYMRVNNIRRPAGEQQGYDNIIVKVEHVDMVADVEQMIQDMGYETWSMQSIRDQLKDSTRMIQLILGGLGAISMFVAALSITNTMTMAIYERTKEIGVMKVLGCKLNSIRTMFLIEAGMIGFMGGAIGIVISYVISFGLNRLGAAISGGMGTTNLSVIPLWLVLLGLGFSTLVGIGSGFAPSNRAVKISALEAIRHD